MAYTFDAFLAADPSNPANIAANAVVTIWDPADVTKSPITLTDLTGSPLANPITVNKNGFGPAFMSETLDRVGWNGGGFEGFFTSYEGLKNEAVAARAAAEAAESAAGAAVTLAETAAQAPTDEAVDAGIGRADLPSLVATAVASDSAPANAAAVAVNNAMNAAHLGYVIVEAPSTGAVTVGPTVTTLRGTPTYGTPSVDGKGALTTGVLQLVFSTEMKTAIAGADFTAEAWIRRDTNPAGTVGVFGHGNLYVGMEATGKIRLRSGNTNTLLSATDVADAAFHHVAACMTLSSDRVTYTNIQLWVDGVLVGTTATEAGSTGWTDTWAIGGLPAAGVDFGGIIDELRLSKGRRYTATFTPAQRFAIDANTLSIMHLDTGPGMAVGGYPDRPAGAVAGAVTYIGTTQPQDSLQYDRWVKA